MVKSLRIFISVIGLIAFGSLIALWIRSWYIHDMLTAPFSITKRIWIQSSDGRLNMSAPWPGGGKSQWRIGWNGGIRVGETVGRGFPRPVGRSLRFELWEERPIKGVYIPYWFPVLLAGMLAYAPWIKWHFSLRTLLIALGLIVVLGGILVILM